MVYITFCPILPIEAASIVHFFHLFHFFDLNISVWSFTCQEMEYASAAFLMLYKLRNNYKLVLIDIYYLTCQH